MAKVVLTSIKTRNFADDDIEEAVERAIDRLDFHFGDALQNVVIKPNLCYYWNYSTGETTDPRVVSAVIDYVRDKVGNDPNIVVAEADASAMKTEYSFRVLGYDKLCQEKNVKLENLSEGNIVDVKVNVSGKDVVLPINEILLNADLVINVPKLKTHNFVGATCALKNMFGAISKPRKYSYHEMISHVIVGVNKIVRSDIIVVDGIICRGARPKKLGAIITGDDCVATDFIAAKIAGFNPKRIQHLVMAKKEKIGHINNIELIEDYGKLTEIKKNFPRYNYSMRKFSFRMQLKMLKMYARLTGDIIPPVLWENGA